MIEYDLSSHPFWAAPEPPNTYREPPLLRYDHREDTPNHISEIPLYQLISSIQNCTICLYGIDSHVSILLPGACFDDHDTG